MRGKFHDIRARRNSPLSLVQLNVKPTRFVISANKWEKMTFSQGSSIIFYFTALLIVPRIRSTVNNYNTILRKEGGLPEDVINVISHCYLKNQSFVLSGNWSNDEIGMIVNKISNPLIPLFIIGLKENVHFKRHQRLKNVYKMSVRVIRKKKYPGSTFIIIVHDMMDLSKSLAILKKSLLWNHEADFLIISKNIQTECQNARLVLDMAWRYHILSAVFLCYDKDKTVKIYTFNPYTNFAPNFWSFIRKHESTKSSWTLYRRSLDFSLKNSYGVLCKKLFFDKTRNLEGYTIKAGVYIHPLFLPLNRKESGLDQFGGLSGHISAIIWKHLNATLLLGNYSKSQLVDDNTLPQSFLRDLLKGNIDVTLNVNLLRDFWKLQSYPQHTAGFCIVSLKHTSQKKLDNIFLLQSEWFIICCLVIVCLLGCLRYVTKRSYSFAFLESIRVIINSRIGYESRSFGGRQSLMNFMFIAMILRIYFQSYLTAFDEVPGHSTAIDTLDKMLQSDVYIYGPLNYEDQLRDLDIRNRYRFGVFKDCLDRLLSGQQLVCLAGCYESRFLAYEAQRIRISKPIKNYYLAFSTSEDWPLIGKFNKMLMFLTEAGLVSYILHQESNHFAKPRNWTSNYPKLSWENVKITWYLWLAGLTVAALVFLIELSWHKMSWLHFLLLEKRI